jgi:hypothetical protein
MHLPVSSFWLRTNSLSALQPPISCGMPPASWLEHRRSTFRWPSSPRHAGRWPRKLLLSSTRRSTRPVSVQHVTPCQLESGASVAQPPACFLHGKGQAGKAGRREGGQGKAASEART